MYKQAKAPNENTKNVADTTTSIKQVGDDSIFQFVDNRPEAIQTRKLQSIANNFTQIKQARGINRKENFLFGKRNKPQEHDGESARKLKDKNEDICSRISQFRSSQIIQRRYAWSDIGDDGVLIDNDNLDEKIIKLGGYDEIAVPLDRFGGKFGFKISNAHVVTNSDDEWNKVVIAVREAGGWDKNNSDTPKVEALIMDRLPGVPLHKTTESLSANDKKNPTNSELVKITKMCKDLGKMLVMDLVTRNNDRFNLVSFDDDLLSTVSEKELDEDDWRRWMGNEGNVLVDEDSGEANPIDSQFTEASNELQYAHNVANLITRKIDDLVDSGMSILENHNWSEEGYAKKAFKTGIENGIECLLRL